MITVANRHAGARGQYIGRGTVLGNDVGEGKPRAEAIRAYRKQLERLIETEPTHPTVSALVQLRRAHDRGEEITLVCSCKPKPCHGDVIVEFVEGDHLEHLL